MVLKIVKSRVEENHSQPAPRNVPAKDDPVEAIRLLEEVFRANPASEDVFSKLESLCREHGQREALRRALVARLNHASDPEALNRLGVFLFEEGQSQAAIRCFEAAVRLGSELAQGNLKQVRQAKRDARVGRRIDPEIHDLLKRLQPKLSACMIVKDEERFLAQCLDSLRGVVDEMIVVDTGSTDKTVAIAKRHGAKVFHFPWCDDFAAARNASLAHATGDWVLIIDADEHLAPESKEVIRRAIAVPAASSYFVQLEDQAEEGVSAVAMLPRLFRRADGAYFTGRIHEQITPQLHKLGYVDRNEPGIRLIHQGYRQEIIQERGKRARNIVLLEAQLSERPNDPYVLFQLGKEYRFEGENLARAVELLRAACEGIAALSPLPPSGGEAFYQLAHALYLGGQAAEAIPVCRQGLSLYPDYPDTRYLLGRLLLEQGKAGEAIEHFRACRLSHGVASASSRDLSYTSWRALWGEGACWLALDQPKEAIEWLEKAQAEGGGGLRAIALDLARAFAATGDPRRALAQLYAFPATEMSASEWVGAAALHMKLGEYPEALDSLERALGLDSRDSEAHRLKGECLLWLGRPQEALDAFAQAGAAEPGQVNALSGWVVCQMILGAYEQAERYVPQVDTSLQGLFAIARGAVGELPPLSASLASAWALVCRHALAAERMELPEAVIAFALDSSERFPHLSRRLASVLLEFGAADLALDLLQKALPASERDVEHFGLLGQALEMLGEKDLAREAYQACLVLVPLHPVASARLAVLKA